MQTLRRPSLLFCVLMDMAGYATYAIPILGEVGDVLWAPLSALLFFISFGGRKAMAGTLVQLFEELLPGTDFIPTFTLMWLWQNLHPAKHPLQTELPR
ncbi:MAG: hypothetical protein ACK4E8_07330 [Lacibacter sp.]|jgi:hypothetical protein